MPWGPTREMAALDRWNDDRLDDLHEQVRRMTPAVEQIGVLTEQMRSLGRSIDQLRYRLDEGSKRASAWKIGLTCAAAGSVVGWLAMIVTGGHP